MLRSSDITTPGLFDQFLLHFFDGQRNEAGARESELQLLKRRLFISALVPAEAPSTSTNIPGRQQVHHSLVSFACLHWVVASRCSIH